MIYKVKVKPGVKKGDFVEEYAGEEYDYVVGVRAKAHDGEANEAVMKTLAEYFGVARGKVRIRSGMKGRVKVVEIDGGR